MRNIFTLLRENKQAIIKMFKEKLTFEKEFNFMHGDQLSVLYAVDYKNPFYFMKKIFTTLSLNNSTVSYCLDSRADLRLFKHEKESCALEVEQGDTTDNEIRAFTKKIFKEIKSEIRIRNSDFGVGCVNDHLEALSEIHELANKALGIENHYKATADKEVKRLFKLIQQAS